MPHYDFKIWEKWDSEPFVITVEGESSQDAYDKAASEYPDAWKVKSTGVWCFITRTMVPFAILVGIAWFLWTLCLPLLSPDKTTGSLQDGTEYREHREEYGKQEANRASIPDRDRQGY